MPTIVDFNKHYQRCRDDCGEPFMEVVDFFAALGESPATVQSFTGAVITGSKRSTE